MRSLVVMKKRMVLRRMKTCQTRSMTTLIRCSLKILYCVLSKEINESFRQSSQARTKLPSGIEMSVHVLTTGYWPTYPPMDVRLPHELNVYQIWKKLQMNVFCR